MRPIIGIDPGVKGSLAIITNHKKKVVTMPETPALILEAIINLTKIVKPEEQKPLAIIEKLHAFQPKGESRGNSAAILLKNVGRLEMALVGCQVEYEEVSPLTWQSYMNLLNMEQYYPEEFLEDGFKATTTMKKQVHYELSQKVFLGIEHTKEMCDSILLCEFGRRIQTGEIELKSKHLRTKIGSIVK